MKPQSKNLLLLLNLGVWMAQGLYTVSPIDLLPDFIPVVGWVDDLLGLVVAVGITIYTVNVVRKHGWSAVLPAGGAARHAGPTPAERRLRDRLYPDALDTEGDDDEGYRPVDPATIAEL